MLDTVKKFVFNKTFALAAITVVTVILGQFGIQIPHVPDSIITLVFAALTGIHAVTAQEAAYLQGLIESTQQNAGA
jgi:hypothetical protein